MNIALVPLLVLWLAWPATEARGTPSLDRFLRESGPVCAVAPAGDCLSRLFAFLDADRDRRIVLTELRRARREAGSWLARYRDRLAPFDRNLADGLLWIVDLVGLDSLLAGYDADGDGGLTAAELFADIRPDARPLGELLRDPQAFDWPRLRARFGRVALLLRALLEGLD